MKISTENERMAVVLPRLVRVVDVLMNTPPTDTGIFQCAGNAQKHSLKPSASGKEGQMSEQWHYEQKGESYIKVDTLHKIRTLETELAAARKGIAKLKEQYTPWWARKRSEIDKLREVTEQRDRLAEALEEIMHHEYCCDREYAKTATIAVEALQSLNQDHTVAANDMISAVKGGIDE